MILLFPSTNIFSLLVFILLVAVPAWWINLQLTRWIRPRESFSRLFLYILAALLAAVLFTFLASLILLKWVFGDRLG